MDAAPHPAEGFPHDRYAPLPPAYRPIGRLTRWVMALTVLSIVVSVALNFFPAPEAPADADDAAATEAYFRDIMVWSLFVLPPALLIALPQLVLALVWMHRARSNLDSLGVPGLKGSPGWSVGAWFVPVANWFLCYPIVKQIWGGPATPTPSWFNLWWGLWVASGMLSLAAIFLGDWIGLARTILYGTLYVAAGGLFLRFLFEVASRQDAHAERTGLLAGRPMPGPA